MEKVSQGISGTLVLLSCILAYYAHAGWLFFAGAVGLHLLLSALIGRDLIEFLLRRRISAK